MLPSLRNDGAKEWSDIGTLRITKCQNNNYGVDSLSQFFFCWSQFICVSFRKTKSYFVKSQLLKQYLLIFVNL